MAEPLLAAFRGGPLDGQRFYVESSLWEWVCWERKHLHPAEWGRVNPATPVPAWEHRYRRLPDCLRDGAVEFLWQFAEERP